MTTNTNNSLPSFDADDARASDSITDALLAYADALGLARDAAAAIIVNADDELIADDDDYSPTARAMHDATRACFVFDNGLASFDTFDDIVSDLDERGLTDY